MLLRCSSSLRVGFLIMILIVILSSHNTSRSQLFFVDRKLIFYNNYAAPLRCESKLFEKDLKGRVMIVTGANSGCGLETSLQLAKQGATVVLACRSKAKGESAAKDVQGRFIAPLNLSSLDSITDFVNVYFEEYDCLDALINNAGIMACPFGNTKDGFEMQFGCNHLVYFLLMCLLTPFLLKTAEKTNKPSHFVALLSVAASEVSMGEEGYATIDFDDLMFEKREYDEAMAYHQSKLANYLHAMEAAKKHSADKLILTAVHPGWVYSNLHNHFMRKILSDNMFARFVAEIMHQHILFEDDMIKPQDGEQMSFHCILENGNKVKNGGFYSQFGVYKSQNYSLVLGQ